jgi:hypothetical protein
MKPAEICNVACQPSNITVQHVDEVRNYQYDTGPEKFAETKKNAASDIYADRRSP